MTAPFKVSSQRSARTAGICAAAFLLCDLTAQAKALNHPDPVATRRQMEYNDKVIINFARCIVLYKHRELPAFLKAPPGTSASFFAAKDMDKGCLTGVSEATLSTSLLRAAIYDALYRRDFAAVGPLPVAKLAPLNFSSEIDSTGGYTMEQFHFGRSFGDCVARAATPDVHAVLMTNIDTDQETAAIEKLAPSLSLCLPPDRTLAFSKQMLRGYLAEAIYKLAKAYQAQSSSLFPAAYSDQRH